MTGVDLVGVKEHLSTAGIDLVGVKEIHFDDLCKVCSVDWIMGTSILKMWTGSRGPAS